MIPDSKVGQLDAPLPDSGILPLFGKELEGRPCPSGLPVRTVLVGLLLALHYRHGANLADAFRILADHLRPTARSWLGVPDLTGADPHARLAFSRRVYRAFDRLTTALDPHRGERRRRLPAAEAAAIAAAWEDNEPEHVRRRTLLQEIGDRLVLVTVQLAHGRVAQTLLLALMILTINVDILRSWTQTSTPVADNEFTEENTGRDGQRPPVSSTSGIPPPAGTRTTASNTARKRRRSRPIFRSDGISSTTPELTQEQSRCGAKEI